MKNKYAWYMAMGLITTMHGLEINTDLSGEEISEDWNLVLNVREAFDEGNYGKFFSILEEHVTYEWWEKYNFEMVTHFKKSVPYTERDKEKIELMKKGWELLGWDLKPISGEDLT